MPQPVDLYRLFIASPGGCDDLRDEVEEAVRYWNSAHSKKEAAVIHPVRWEVDAPRGAGNPQEHVNPTLDDCDLLVGIFRWKIGSPGTGSIPATVEEIDRAIAKGKPVLVFFSSEQPPNDVDLPQLEALRTYKERVKRELFYGEFTSKEDFRTKVSHEIGKRMNLLLEKRPSRGAGGTQDIDHADFNEQLAVLARKMELRWERLRRTEKRDTDEAKVVLREVASELTNLMSSHRELGEPGRKTLERVLGNLTNLQGWPIPVKPLRRPPRGSPHEIGYRLDEDLVRRFWENGTGAHRSLLKLANPLPKK